VLYQEKITLALEQTCMGYTTAIMDWEMVLLKELIMIVDV
jgi:hypothetical protein